MFTTADLMYVMLDVLRYITSDVIMSIVTYKYFIKLIPVIGLVVRRSRNQLIHLLIYYITIHIFYTTNYSTPASIKICDMRGQNVTYIRCHHVLVTYKYLGRFQSFKIHSYYFIFCITFCK